MALAGCGASDHSTSSHSRPRQAQVASRVCTSAGHSAATLLAAPVKTRISDSDPTNIECVVSGTGISADVVAQAAAGAFDAYNVTRVQQAQAYGWGTAQMQKELPHSLATYTFNADWLPAVDEMIATNGTLTRGGSFVTVTVTRARRDSRRRPSSMTFALAITRGTLAVAPRGPKPGPPPP